MEGTIPAIGSVSTSIISSVVNRIVRTRTISRTDQRLLMSLLSKSILSDTDMDLVNRVYRGLHDGRIRVVE
ncbi:MAG: hypothetical protein AAGD25_00435 [Cyanobacteria bacterium P01_F01_bin.150]